MGGKGDNLENQVKLFFSTLLQECGYEIIKNRKQNSGTQDGFDNEIIVSKNFLRKSIYIECKDYSTKLIYAEALVKLPQIYSTYEPDLILFISPKVPFSNPYNDTKLIDFYNLYPTPVEFLTPDNNIEELFAINPEVYKSVYGRDCKITIDKERKIKWFKEFLFSSKPFKKIILNENERSYYITNITLTKNYIERTYSLPNTDKNTLNIYSSSFSGTLFSTLKNLIFNNLDEEKENDGLVILGNPGLGKSVDLKNLAIKLWDKRNEEPLIPFFREIKTFSTTSNIIDFLPKNWKEISHLIVILDGLDELSNIQEFCSKLEKFTIDNRNKKNIVKFILSCRTNIYDNIVKDINGIKPLILDEIYLSNSIKFLEENYGLTQDDSFKINYNHKEFLENPYYLTLFGEFYTNEKSLPKSKSDLIGQFVKKRLADDDEKFKKRGFQKTKVVEDCKKVALISEAMQQNDIDESKLNILLENKNTFICSSFSEKVFGFEKWKFEHRNLQEYFVADTLKNLSFSEIINFISIDEYTTKTHPSWLNSISFLISLIDKNSKLFNYLIDWLVQNDPQVLFKADSNRLSKQLKFEIFKEYFEKRCKEETLWIRTFDVEIFELANFANSEISIKYLFEEIERKGNHRRAKISAFDLLSYMTLNDKKEQVKRLVIKILKAPKDEIDFRFKADVLYGVRKLKFHIKSNFIRNIISALGDIDFHEIMSPLFSLIEDDEPENYSSFIKRHLPKVFDESKRLYKKTDNLSTNEESTIISIIKRFQNKENLLFVLNFYLSDYDKSYSRIKDEKNDIQFIISKLVKLYAKEKSIYNNMIVLVKRGLLNSSFTYEYESYIFKFFIETGTTKKAFENLYSSKIEFSKKRHSLTRLANKENIIIFINDFISGKIDEGELIYFKNNLSHTNFDLALHFQNLIEENTQIKLNKKLSIGKREKWTKFHNEKHQNSFDLLFKKKQILRLIKKYFKKHKNGVITWDNNRENKKEYWGSPKMQLKYPQSFMSIINDSLRANNGTTNEEKTIKLLEEELYLIYKIRNEIFSNKDRIIVHNKQLNKIKNWCDNNIDKADFENYRIRKNHKNSLRCELLWYFRNKFDFVFPNNVLLDMLFIDGSLENNSKYIGYDYLRKRLPNKELNERILKNLKDGNLTHTILNNHLFYVIENELIDGYNLVEEHLEKNTDRAYNKSSILYKYFEKNQNIPFLKRLFNPHDSDEDKDGLSWDAIKLLIAAGENEFVIEKLLDFRRKKNANKKLLVVIKFLMRANYEKSFLLFNNWLTKEYKSKKQIRSMIDTDDYILHKNKKSINQLIKLFKIGHDESWNFEEMHHPIRIARETLENICKNSDPEICEKTIKLLEKTKKEFTDNNMELFHINSLIHNIKSHYYNLKSKPASFHEIAVKIDNLKYKLA